jgi:BirA family biotin operon repressor/biotin-[acetyl-CoA-carboxylase] ligase
MRPLSQQLLWNILSCLDVGSFGANVHYYERVSSTNDIARRLAENHAPEGTLVVANEQTAGRGRLHRQWTAPPGTSLLMSVLFRPSLLPEQIQRLVMACGVATAEACESLAGVQVDVKWPNDLLVAGRKFAGILAESAVVASRFVWVIVGMGINVSQRYSLGHPLYGMAASLAEASGKEIDRAELLGEIMTGLNTWNGRLLEPALLETWRARCVTLGQRVRVESAGHVTEGAASDISQDGSLILIDDAGHTHHIASGDATIIRR